MMSRIRGRDTKPELRVRRFLHARGFRYRLHARDLPGAPDIVLPRYRSVVFVHGCFWHRHPGCRFAYRPKTRAEFWEAKFEGNVERDNRNRAKLERGNWRVFVVWECEISEDHLALLARAIGHEATA
jgi:DNA mismatch endonuclease (patch repair protein)